MRKVLTSITIFSLIAFLFSACSVTKKIPDDQALLKKNRVEIEEIDTINDPRPSFEGNLEDLIQQEPNSKLLWINRAVFYNEGRDTSKWFNRFLNFTLGEEPVVFDSSAAIRSAKMMDDYLFNKGYFNAEVDFETEIENKKARITYEVLPKSLTWINEVNYELEDNRIDRLVLFRKEKSALQPGQPYDVNNLLDERQRITNTLRDHGYWNFNKQYVYFEIDTLKTRDSLAVFVKIQDPEDDSTHHIYTINKVYMYPDYQREDTASYGTGDTVQRENISIISKDLKYRPEALICANFFHHGNLYSREDHELTLNRLSDLGVFRFVNITFEEIRDTTPYQLNVIIRLIPAEKQDIAVNAELNTGSDYLIGGDLGFSYQNKNLFRYTDLFVFNFDAGVEADSLRANTLELNADASIYFPKFIIPFTDFGCLSRAYNPKTRFTVGYNYFQRIEYFTLNSFSFTYAFEWNQFTRQRHQFSPLSINVVRRSNESPSFQELLNNNPLLRESFSNQVILSSIYSFTYNTQTANNFEDYYRFRTNADVTLPSYILFGAQSMLQGSEEAPFELFGQNYSTYIKPDVEFIRHNKLNRTSALVGRAFAGIGYAVGNTEVMPYIKQYNVGGPNSIRAFRIRSIGPGAYSPAEGESTALDFIDQVGDIKLEGNLEYRFDITGIFEGAVFLDAGNVWLLRNDPNKPEGKFEFNDFYREMALGTGVGLRLDFNFFILRFDFGYPLRDPRLLAENNGWVNGFDFGNINFNLAIGYPF